MRVKYRYNKLLLFFFFFWVLSAGSAKATHLIGGNIGYEYVGHPSANPNMVIYRINFSTYIDCNSVNWGTSFPESSFQIEVYEGTINQTTPMQNIATATVTLSDSAQIDPTMTSGCNFGTSTCIYLVNYEGLVVLPLSSTGYHLIYERCCRPAGIINLTNSGNQGMSFQAYIPPNTSTVSTTVNGTPAYTDTLVSYICVNDTAYIANTATDPDGDSLVYSIEQPYRGYTSNTVVAMNTNNPNWANYTYPPQLVVWGGGASAVNPFGAGGYVAINSSTGLTSFLAPTAGIYVIAVEVKEYRNGVLIGRTRRDIQIMAVNCPNNPKPVIGSITGHANALNNSTLQIVAGDSVCLTLNATTTAGTAVAMTANGVIFDTAQVNPAATFVSTTDSLGNGIGTFCWETSCDQGRSQPYSFTVQAKDDGCPPMSDVDAFNIYVVPYAGPDSLVGPDTVCYGNHLGVQYTIPNPGDYVTYNWSVTGGTIVGSNTDSVVTVDWNPNTIGEIAIDAISSSGCSADTVATFPIYIGASLTIDAGTDTINCYGDTITLGTGNNDPQISYVWSPSTSFITPNQGASDYVVTQTDTLLLTGTDTVGCSDSSTVVVAMYDPIGTVTITGEDTLCYGDQNNNVYTAPFGAAFLYNWSVSNGAIVGQSASNQVTVDWNAPAFGILTVLVQDTNGCSMPTVDYTVRVGAAIPADAGNDTIVCEGETVQLGEGTSNTDYLYSWSPVAGLTSTNMLHTAVEVMGTATYVLTVIDSLECMVTDSVVVNQFPIFNVDITSSDVQCEGDTLDLMATDAVTYSWTPASLVSDATVQHPYAMPDSTTTFTVYATDSNGCHDSDSIFVTIQEYPDFSLYFDTALFLGQSGTAEVYTDMDELSFLWSPPEGLSCTSCLNPIMTPEYSTTYTLNVSDPSGCFNIDTAIDVVVHRDYSYYIPNAFSPDGNGLNDEIKVYTWGVKSLKEFSIFNRWGEMLFTTDQLDKGWDGMYKGERQPGQTVYVYRVVLERYTGDLVQEQGKIVLIR